MSLDPKYIVPYLKQIPLFSELNEEECLDIVRTFSMETKKTGELLCIEGAASEGMYILEGGEVEVEKKTVQGTSEKLATLGKQDVVGEMSLLDGRECSATVRATKDLAYYKIDKQQFLICGQSQTSTLQSDSLSRKNVMRKVTADECQNRGLYADPKTSLKEMKKRKDAIMEEWRQTARIGAGSRTTQAGTL